MNYKIISYISFAIILLVLAKWIIDSVDYGGLLVFSKDKKAIVIKVHDELLGTDTEKTEWKEGYWFGLLPNEDRISIKAVIAVIPLGGFFFLLGFVSLFINNRCHKRPLKVEKGG